MRGKPLFENIFGKNNRIKVLDFFVMGNGFDFTLSHVANGTGLSRTAVRHSIEELEKTSLVAVSRVQGKSTYYSLNKKSNKYNLLNRLYSILQEDVLANQ